MTETFIPVDFIPPREAAIGEYVLRPLAERYVDADMEAVNSSVDTIRETRGGKWPQQPVTRDENLGDLIEHERLFDERSAFAYSVFNPDGSEYIGCVYIYPPNHPFDDSDKSGMPPESDAVVNFWVAKAAFDRGVYPALFKLVSKWISEDWPFHNPYISNKLKP